MSRGKLMVLQATTTPNYTRDTHSCGGTHLFNFLIGFNNWYNKVRGIWELRKFQKSAPIVAVLR